MERIGLIAGSGKFPIIFTKTAKEKGVKVVAFAIRGITHPDIEDCADKVHWFDLTKFSIPAFTIVIFASRVKDIVMAGKVDKAKIFGAVKGNKEIEGFLKSAKDGNDYSILEEATNRFKKAGIRVAGALDYLQDILPEKGVLTKRAPTEKESADIHFGISAAKELARLDIGQTITVKNKAIVTVEAMEGTDETIKRAQTLVKDDFVVIKVARPKQDMRWDVPVIGSETIKTMAHSFASAIAIESGKMFLVEKEKTIREADSHNISILCV